MISKVCSTDHLWSTKPQTNLYFVLHGALTYCMWAMHRKSLGTTVLIKENIGLILMEFD